MKNIQWNANQFETLYAFDQNKNCTTTKTSDTYITAAPD